LGQESPTQPAARLEGAPTSLLLTAAVSRSSAYNRDLLRAWIDHLVLAAAGRDAHERRRVLIRRAEKKACEEASFAPMTSDEARGYLTTLAADLLAGVYPWFLPCEGMLGWAKKNPKPALTEYILMLREDNFTWFSSEWGPVPDARDYPTPPEDEAQAVFARRFRPFFDSQLQAAAPAAPPRNGRGRS